MPKINPTFPHDLYRFIHKPIRDADRSDGGRFLERYSMAFQRQFEAAYAKMSGLLELYDPAKTPQPWLLKDIVGFTRELDPITEGLTTADLRKLISLAVPLWKKKGLEVGYRDIIRLFTGKNSRTFNWFDFRYIVGEQSLAQEELGEDSWIISKPLIFASTPLGGVVGLWSFEQNLRDGSLTRNDATAHGPAYFYGPGPLGGSAYYLSLAGDGAISAPNSSKYDLSGSFTVEMYVRASVAQNAILFRKSDGIRTVEIRFNSAGNSITYTLDDGVSQYTETVVPSVNMDDGTWRHLALIVDRSIGTTTARLFYDSDEVTTGVDISGMGDLTNSGPIWIGASGPSADRLTGDLDSLRLSLAAQYNVGAAFLPVPANAFIEYREEQLDEFYTDVRIVDEGDLNRTLVRRILNLMRPPSERLRLIYIKFFESFEFGKGGFLTASPGAAVIDDLLEMPAGSREMADTAISDDYKDIVLQVRLTVRTGGRFGIRFLVQDDDNYYLTVLDTAQQQVELYKVAGGVPTALSTPSPTEVFNGAFYIITVLTDRIEVSGENLIKVLLDGDVMHNVLDTGYEMGTFGLEAMASSSAAVSHVELFTMPLEVETVGPNFVG